MFQKRQTYSLYALVHQTRHPMSDYKDYLNMLDDLGLDQSKDYLAMPKDWEDMHTNIVLNHTAYLEAQKEKALSKEDKALAKKRLNALKPLKKPNQL